MGGVYSATPSLNWTALAGGQGYDSLGAMDSYWLVNITGTDWSGNRLAGVINGKALSYHSLATLSSDMLGTYGGLGTWQALSIGTFTATPLQFVSSISGDRNFSVMGNYSLVDRLSNGSFNALFGGTGALVSSAPGSIWTATATDPAAVTMMGSYTTNNAAVPSLWTSYFVDSYNYDNQTKTTYDNGAYKGFFAATDVNGSIDGKFIGLYIDPSGNIGYLKGALAGDNYQDLSMFSMNGGISATQMASKTSYVQAGFVNSNIWANIWRDIGSFTMDGTIGSAGYVGDRQKWNGHIDTLAIADYQNKSVS